MKRKQMEDRLRQRQKRAAKKEQQRFRNRVFGYWLVHKPSEVNIHQRRHAMEPYIRRSVARLIRDLADEALEYGIPIALTGDVMGMHNDPLTNTERSVLRSALGDIFQVAKMPELSSDEDIFIAGLDGISLFAQLSKAGRTEYYMIPS